MADNGSSRSGGGGGASVFDNYGRVIRGSVIRGSTNFVNTWSDCARALRWSVNISYTIMALCVFLLIAVVFKFNSTWIVLFLCVLTILSVYNSLWKRSCFKAFGIDPDVAA